ncbi:MAG: phosphate ABC transporter permease subunit PstC [bacterium]
MKRKKIKEFLWENLIAFASIFSIIILILIFVYLLRDGLPVFSVVSIKDFLTGKLWYPISSPAKFGILPLIEGSLLVTALATAIAAPLGVGCAFYIAEIAPPKIRDFLKIIVELIAGIPSVVLGFIGMVTLSVFVKNAFHISTGLTAFTGGIVLAFMAIPTIATISEDAIYSVPKDQREASLALGATKWQTLYKVIFPSSLSGIIAAVMLGVGRAIGETMVVMMVCGNSAVIPHTIFQPVRTLTATIAAEMGETVRGSDHYHALFAIGITLFCIAFVINLIADVAVRRKGARA